MGKRKKDIFYEMHRDLPREGPGRDRYTRRAFQMLPPLEKPRILDIGCGPGGPTMELARLTDGEVIGMDIHQPYLDALEKKIEAHSFSERVHTLNCSLFEMDFEPESFDLIWSEGSIWVIGFERGLAEWRLLIRPDGFLVVHEMTWLRPDPPEEIAAYWQRTYPGITTVPENIRRIGESGFELLGHFALPEDAWWVEYYGPLQERIDMLREKYAGDFEALRVLDEEQLEIDLYRKYQPWYGSAFFVMQKRA